MKHSIDDIKRWKSYGFVMTPVENKRPKGKTWRKDWSDDELLKAERLGFYQKDSNVFTIDFDDQGFVAHKYINMLPDTFTDGKKVNGNIIATHKTYKVNGVAPPKFKYPPKASKKDGLILETLSSKQTTFVGKGKHVIRDVPPTEIDVADLECKLKLISFMQEVEKKWVKVGTGQSDEAHLRLAAALARLPEKQYPTDVLEGFVEQLCLNVGDREIKNRTNKISYQREQLKKDVETVYTIGELGKFLNANFKAYDLFKEQPIKQYPMIDSLTFSSIEYPKPKYLLYPILTDKGVNSFYGDSGGGKTMFAMSAGMYIASKRDFLIWKCHNAMPVLYVEAELPAEDIRDRRNSIQENFITNKKQFNAQWFFTLTCDDLELNGLDGFAPLAVSRDMSNLDKTDYGLHGRRMIENLQERIFKKCGVKPLTFLDNVGHLTDMDENRQSDWTPFINWTIRRKTRGFPTVWVHHSNKAGSSSGSEAKRRALNTELKLEELGDDQRFNLPGNKNVQSRLTFTKKRHFGGSSWAKPLLLTMNEHGDWNKYPPLKKVDFKIVELTQQGLTVKEILEDPDVNLSKASVYNKIQMFKKEGIIKT